MPDLVPFSSWFPTIYRYWFLQFIGSDFCSTYILIFDFFCTDFISTNFGYTDSHRGPWWKVNSIYTNSFHLFDETPSVDTARWTPDQPLWQPVWLRHSRSNNCYLARSTNYHLPTSSMTTTSDRESWAGNDEKVSAFNLTVFQIFYWTVGKVWKLIHLKKGSLKAHTFSAALRAVQHRLYTSTLLPTPMVLMFRFGTNNVLGTRYKLALQHAQFFQLQGMKYHMGYPDGDRGGRTRLNFTN